jgi:hypothetical protein
MARVNAQSRTRAVRGHRQFGPLENDAAAITTKGSVAEARDPQLVNGRMCHNNSHAGADEWRGSVLSNRVLHSSGAPAAVYTRLLNGSDCYIDKSFPITVHQMLFPGLVSMGRETGFL